METTDGGQTWSNPKSLKNVLGEIVRGDTLVRICDVTPQLHHKSNKILATGVTVYYKDSAQFSPSPRETCYFSYNTLTSAWTSWKTLKMPDRPEFYHSSVGCSQWVDLPNGDILLPIYFLQDSSVTKYSVTVLRCHFDGKDLTYIENGNYLQCERERGFVEPQLIEFNSKYYLSLRNDINGFVCASDDGLHYDEPVEWMFNDSTFVWTENTQQHWVKSPRALFLVYTSSHREESANVYRGGAPLFMAQFDEKKMCLLKETEQIIVPNNGAALRNFGACEISESESWVTASEEMRQGSKALGARGRVYLVKINWTL